MRTVAIGVGNMGGALVRGLVARGVVAPAELVLVDREAERAAALAAELGCEATDLAGVTGQVALFIVAVKPQGMSAVLDELAPSVGDDAVVMSVAAGVTLRQLRAALPAGHMVRAMPNTPALVGQGASAFAVEATAPAEVVAVAQRVLAAVGLAVQVEERHMDAVTAVSGSGPAYVFAFLEALTAAGEAAGLPAEVAAQLARQTVVGAGHLLAARSESAADLRKAVTSPGGTTAAALEVLGRDEALAELMARAVARATARGAELAAAAGR